MPGGKHVGGYKYRNRQKSIIPEEKNSKNASSSTFGTIISAITGAIMYDLNKPDSKIKLLVKRVFSKKKELQNGENNKKDIIDVKYKSIERGTNDE